MSFDAYVRDALDNPKLPHVNVGTQFKFLSLKNATLPLHHLSPQKRVETCISPVKQHTVPWGLLQMQGQMRVVLHMGFPL